LVKWIKSDQEAYKLAKKLNIDIVETAQEWALASLSIWLLVYLFDFSIDPLWVLVHGILALYIDSWLGKIFAAHQRRMIGNIYYLLADLKDEGNENHDALENELLSLQERISIELYPHREYK
jgi:hypothetical protein